MGYEDAKLAFAKDERAEQHFAEARFGQTYMSPKIEALPAGANVLEVGCGSAILLCRLAMQNPDISFLGLEPTGEGFNYTNAFHGFANSLPNAALKTIGYEDLETETRYDIIYLINVFEHLPNWRDFLSRLQSLLKPSGTCLILCPNYSFPYEPHFRLPIIINKSVSQKLFGRQIEKIEDEENGHGLWNSLNFVKYRQIISIAKTLGLTVAFEKSIINDMIDRLNNDPEFLNRQKILKWPVWFAKKTRLINAISEGRIFEAILPYMYLSITQSNDET